MSNEGKACDAVVRLLEIRSRKTRADVSRPEQDGTRPPVDLRLRLGTQNYAIEHTRIEAFAGQIDMGVGFGQLIRPVINELSGTLPKPGVYHLYFPTNARLRVRRRELHRIQADLLEWVREQAHHLHASNPDKPTRERNPHGIVGQCQARPPGVPYEVTLRREVHWSLSSRHDGVLLASRFAPQDVEALRKARLQEALEDKCPKLQRCKDEGDRTVLVLEDGDISLSNHVIIGDLIAALLPERPDLPDEIYLVETSLNRWDVRLVKHDENCVPQEDWTEFDSGELKDITGA